MAVFFWSTTFAIGRYCAPYIPPSSIVFFRFVFAFAVLKIVLLFWPKSDYKLQKSDYKIIFFVAFCGMFGYQMLFFKALHVTTATNASIIMASSPIVTTLLGAIVLKQSISKQMALGIVISFIGVFLTITGADWETIRQLNFNLGDLIMLVTVLLWAAYLLISKKSQMPSMVLTYYNFIVTIILAFPFFLLEKPWTWMPNAPIEAWLGIIFMAIFPSVCAYCANQVVIREIGPQRASIFMNLIPGFAMLTAVLMLGEPFMLIKVVTMVIIVIGVCLCQLSGQSKDKAL